MGNRLSAWEAGSLFPGENGDIFMIFPSWMAIKFIKKRRDIWAPCLSFALVAEDKKR